VTLLISYRAPYDWEAILAHLAVRAIPGVEHVDGKRYSRTVADGAEDGTVTVSNVAQRHALAVTIRFPSVRALPVIVGRVKRVFDVGADVAAIGTQLSADPTLTAAIARRPGLRVPGAWDGFELAVRAVLGQQVTLSAARSLSEALVRACNATSSDRTHGPTSMLFPDPARLLATDLGALGMPRSRKAALKALAEAALRDPRLLEPAASLGDAIARLREIRGIGEWTAQYIALRALRETDAFPVTDAGLLRSAAALGIASTPRALRARAESWRPWRAYAAQHLWAADVAEECKQREVAHG